MAFLSRNRTQKRCKKANVFPCKGECVPRYHWKTGTEQHCRNVAAGVPSTYLEWAKQQGQRKKAINTKRKARGETLFKTDKFGGLINPDKTKGGKLPETYRRRAEEARAIGEKSKDPKIKVLAEETAKKAESVAERAEKSGAGQSEKADKSVLAQAEKLKSALDLDLDYLKAVKNGDMDTASALVKQAASQGKYNVGPVYHGTESSFNKFDVPTTQNRVLRADGKPVLGAINKEAASHLFERGARLPSWMIDEELDKAFSLFENKKLTNDIEDSPSPIYFTGDLNYPGLKQSQFIKQVYIKSKKPYFTDNESALEFEPYDSPRFLNEGFDSVMISPQNLRQIAVFDPKQIKSADPVTKTKTGAVVPLSARFDDSVADIRGNVDDIFAGIKSAGGESLAPIISAAQRRFEASGADSVDGLIDALQSALEQVEKIRRG